MNKSLTIIYTVSKIDNPPVFCTQRGSALYLVSHRMTISTNIHLLQPVFTIQGYTGLKVKNILSRFLLFNSDTQSLRFRSFIFKMVAMLQILCIFPCVSCFKRATKAVQCPVLGQKLAIKVSKSCTIPTYVPRVNPPGWPLISA